MAATPTHTGARSNAKLFFFFVKAAAVTVVAVIVASGVWQLSLIHISEPTRH